MWRGTLILAAAVVALLLWVLMVERRGGESGSEAERLLQGVGAEQITAVVMDYPDRKDVRLEKREGKWVVVESGDGEGEERVFDADQAVVSSLLRDIGRIGRGEVISSAAGVDVAEFGLDKPRLKLTVITAEGSTVVDVGDDTPTGRATYVRLGGGSQIVAVPVYDLYPFLSREADEFRNKLVLSLPVGTVTKIRVRHQGVGFGIAREGRRWKALGSAAGVRLDGTKVEELVSMLSRFRVDGFADDSTRRTDSYWGFDRPWLVVYVTAEGRVHTIVFGKKEGGSYYVRVDDRPEVYEVSEFTAERLPTSIDDLRSRDLVAEKLDGADVVEVEWAGGRWRYVRQGGRWKVEEVRSPASVSMPGAEELIRSVDEARIVDFVSDDPSRLEDYGMRPPLGRMVFHLAGGDVTLLLGGRVDGKVYVSVEGEGSVYTVSAETFPFLEGGGEKGSEGGGKGK